MIDVPNQTASAVGRVSRLAGIVRGAGRARR